MDTANQSAGLTGRSRIHSWWPVLVIALLTGVVLFQRWQMTHPPRPQLLVAGQRLPPVVFKSLDGQPVQVGWKTETASTVIYAFSPACRWCKRNVEAVKALAAGTSAKYRFVGVSLTQDGLREYLDKVQFQFPVYVAGSEAKRLKLGPTPETVVVSAEGVVIKVWVGAYVGRTSANIEQTFGFRLPVVQSD